MNQNYIYGAQTLPHKITCLCSHRDKNVRTSENYRNIYTTQQPTEKSLKKNTPMDIIINLYSQPFHMPRIDAWVLQCLAVYTYILKNTPHHQI